MFVCDVVGALIVENILTKEKRLENKLSKTKKCKICDDVIVEKGVISITTVIDLKVCEECGKVFYITNCLKGG